MRNLKRALSLALASVMLLGMMVVGTSAESYPDVNDTHNVEAIEVLKAVQVMEGNPDGTLSPDKDVTRNEMATIMANLKLGKKAAAEYAGTCPFPDVPSWAAKFVAACADNGIVSGRPGNVYDGEATVTAEEAALMMMKALGYDKLAGKGADWARPVVAMANKISLFSDVTNNPKTTLNRNQVAQLALNTLEATMVDIKDDTMSVDTVVGGATTTVSGGQIDYIARVGDNDINGSIQNARPTADTTTSGYQGRTLELGEFLYQGDLQKRVDVVDGFKAPATRWSYKNVEINTYTNKEDCKLEGTVKSSAMYAAVGKTAAEDYRWFVYMDGTTTNWNDGDKPLFTKNDVKDNNSDDLDGTGNGTVTYVYLDNTAIDGFAGTATVCILNTFGAEVTKVKDGKITLDDKSKQLEVESDDYAEGDVVLYTKFWENTNTAKVGTLLGKAELVEGKADTVRAGKFVTIGEKTYNYNAQFNTKNGDKLAETFAGQDVVLYLDNQGNIVFLGDAVEGTNYALVLGVGRSAQYNEAKPIFGAELILADGTSVYKLLNKDDTDKILENGSLGKAAGDKTDIQKVADALVGRVFAYTEEKDGAFSLSTKVGKDTRTMNISYSDWDTGIWKDGDTLEADEDLNKQPTTAQLKAAKLSVNEILSTDKASIQLKDFVDNGRETPLGIANCYANSDTLYILNDKTDGRYDFTVYTGYKNVPDVKLSQYSKMAVYKNAKGIARAVFITNCDISGKNDVVFVVGKSPANNRVEKSGNVEYYVYDAVVKGEVTSIKVKAGTADASEITLALEENEIGIYAGVTFNAEGYVTKLKKISEADKMAVNDSKADKDWPVYTGTESAKKDTYGFQYDGTKYTMSVGTNDDVLIVYFGEYNGENNKLRIETGLNNDIDDKAWVVTDDGDVVAILVDEEEGAAIPEFEAVGLFVEKTATGFTIYTDKNMTVDEIIAAIAKKAGVNVNDIKYDAKNGIATIGNVQYEVKVSKVASDEVNGVKTASAVASAVNSNSSSKVEATTDGNKIYLTLKASETTYTADDCKNTMQAILNDLKAKGVTEITYGTQKWSANDNFMNPVSVGRAAVAEDKSLAKALADAAVDDNGAGDPIVLKTNAGELEIITISPAVAAVYITEHDVVAASLSAYLVVNDATIVVSDVSTAAELGPKMPSIEGWTYSVDGDTIIYTKNAPGLLKDEDKLTAQNLNLKLTNKGKDAAKATGSVTLLADGDYVMLDDTNKIELTASTQAGKGSAGSYDYVITNDSSTSGVIVKITSTGTGDDKNTKLNAKVNKQAYQVELIGGVDAESAVYTLSSVSAKLISAKNNLVGRLTVCGRTYDVTTTSLAEQLAEFVEQYNADSRNRTWTASVGTGTEDGQIVFTAKKAGVLDAASVLPGTVEKTPGKDQKAPVIPTDKT